MRLLMIGAAGLVGSMILPHLATRHQILVLDPRPPAPGPWEHLAGEAGDPEAVAAAAAGADALIYLAMGPNSGWATVPTVAGHFDANVKGVYLALRAAARAGVGHVVLASSMSVYPEPGPGTRYPPEGSPPTATDFYGLTKRFGEQIGEAAATEHGISVVALRLCFPTPDDEWPRTGDPVTRTIATSARDTAAAFEAALAYRGHGFTAVTISGDAGGQVARVDAARRLLGWTPRDPTTAP